MEYHLANGPIAVPQPIRDAQLTAACGHGGCALSEEPLGLPSGYPSTLDSRLAWKGSDFKDEESYVCHMTEGDVAEIKSTLEHFKALELDGDLLAGIGQELHNGKGFSVIRGIKPRDFSVEELTMVWLGIQAHIVDQRGCQDHKGNMLGEVPRHSKCHSLADMMLVHIIADDSSAEMLGHHRHSTSSIVSNRSKSQFTGAEADNPPLQSFHNEEAGDCVGWLTRSTPASGGRCIISSAYHVYNVLAAYRPDMIRTLAKSDWPFAIPKFQCRPVIFYHNSKLIMNFGRTPLLGNATHPRPSSLPQVNDRQREALDAIEAIARATQLEITTQAGDMHFINNMAVLHRREGFVNGQTGREKRHLVRMRLRSSALGWDIPEELKGDWHDAFESSAAKAWHLEPMPGDAFPLRKYTN
ncbi:Taurine hydroxylase-like protein SAT17 [Apiospora aurea]|uniref:Taurine hydroxylase-like protein SAT17 n=1 Tax=Apiospora aurea TaxID=335848 RepID=A0ABR1PVQ5_9PEZI